MFIKRTWMDEEVKYNYTQWFQVKTNIHVTILCLKKYEHF